MRNITPHNMNYQETLDYLFSSLPMFQRIGGAAYKASLDNTEALDRYFEHPHKQYLTIHVAGTNGKGSTSHMLASVLMRAGYRVGLYTSPHLIDFRERIMVNGELISEQEVVDFVTQHGAILESQKPSFFEMTAAMAFQHFKEKSVDIAVIEVGMGGRLDSTNIITPILSIITNIDYDHMQFLGDTLAKIAGEKAGIIKPGVPVVIGETTPESMPVFVQKAYEIESPICFADQMFRCNDSTLKESSQTLAIHSLLDDYVFSVEVDLLGDCQRKNVPTVLAAIEKLNTVGIKGLTLENIRLGLANAAHDTSLRGRWQVIDRAPLTVCDTGHNEAGIRIVTGQLARQNYKKLYIVFGVVSDKDLDHVLPLLPREAYYFFTRAAIERAMPADKLYDRATSAGLQGEVVSTVGEALIAARSVADADDMIFIGGSTFVVADVFL